jgi:ribosomal-protein-alanine N-acetyltransferase
MEDLVTERLLLRRWREADRDPFRRLNADPRVMEFFPATLSAEETDAAMERIDRHFAVHGFGLLAAEDRRDGSFAGFIGLAVPDFEAPFMPAVEIGWRLAATHWGQGLATEGARAVLRYAFEAIGLGSVVSMTSRHNLRSRRVMERLGMTHNSQDDFDHPRLPMGHPLRPHVLYRLSRDQWRDANL